ncbi:MAG: hypothetical protein WAS73_19215 [Defluviicoccus sp.]
MELARQELIELIAFALWRQIDLRPRRRSLDDARWLAEKVVEQLERSGVSWTRDAPPPPHRTPGAAA